MSIFSGRLDRPASLPVTRRVNHSVKCDYLASPTVESYESTLFSSKLIRRRYSDSVHPRVGHDPSGKFPHRISTQSTTRFADVLRSGEEGNASFSRRRNERCRAPAHPKLSDIVRKADDRSGFSAAKSPSTGGRTRTRRGSRVGS